MRMFMKYKKTDTLYIGMKNDGIDAMPGSSEHIHFCMSTIPVFLPVISKLSKAFINAELSSLNVPYNISIFIHPTAFVKFKKSDEETPYDRLIFLLKNLRPPTSPLRITIYSTTQHLSQNWDYSNLWALKDTHDKDKADNIITFHYPEMGMKASLTGAEECFNVATAYAKELNYDIKTIDYTMKYSTVKELLLKTSLHVSYIGASYYFAGLTRTPTLGIGHRPNEKYGNIFTPHFVSHSNMIRLNNKFKLSNGRIDYAIDTIDPDEIKPIISILKERDSNDFFQ